MGVEMLSSMLNGAILFQMSGCTCPPHDVKLGDLARHRAHIRVRVGMVEWDVATGNDEGFSEVGVIRLVERGRGSYGLPGVSGTSSYTFRCLVIGYSWNFGVGLGQVRLQ